MARCGVVRYRAGATGCETLTVDAVYTQGAPTFWGISAAAADDVWFVGGSALPDGPRGVVVHYDGTEKSAFGSGASYGPAR